VTIPEPPRPSRRQVTRFSPTLLDAIDTCKLQAAFSLDATFRGLRRPGPAALLGQAAHRLLEDAARGRFSSVLPAELTSVLQAAWDDEMREAAAQLAVGRLVPPPPPPEWPGYELTRVRLLRRLARRLQQPHSTRPSTTSVMAERPLEDLATGLHGRPDRVEQAGLHVRVVDVKTGLAQSDVRPAQRRQLLLYAYLVHQQLGRWPEEVAVEDVAGRRLVEQVRPAEMAAAVHEAIILVREFNDMLERSPSVLALATPSAEGCRHCPFRVVCWPFLQAVREDWQLAPCFVGVIEETRVDRRLLLLRAEAPRWMTGKRVSVLGVSEGPEAGQAVGLVDAAPAGDSQVRVRWQTKIVLW
jgi:RecB family exonuclease